ncbi:hypothetical protein CPB85DRAFT_1308843 [Mucidula mucida]|nr:hypothetical protein CPB85DRAFT_1308843 [Mucidula mucida]
MVPSFTEEMFPKAQSRQCPQCGYNGNQRNLPNGLDDSRVAELTNCNDPPNDEERIRLEGIYREGDAYMSILEQRIATTRATLDLLIDEQRRASQEIARSKRLLNPIRRLPTEILSTIFLYCSQPDRSTFLVNGHEPVDEDDPSLDSLDPSNMPWVLTYVCSRWRQIVINASELWVYLRLQFDRYDDHLRYLGALVKYLSRAGKRGIQVHLESTKDIAVHPLLTVLMASSSTWLDFCVSIPYDSVCALNAIHGSLQNLESVGIQVTNWPDEMESLQSWTQNWNAFQFAPKLSSLTVYGSEGIAWPHIPLPWHSLTYLDLMGKTQQAVSLISTAHSLQSCYLSLQSLDITSSSPWCSDSISTFFEHFTFPALIFVHDADGANAHRAACRLFGW